MKRIRTTYLDWVITATCRKHSPHDVAGRGRYTGHAIAELAVFEHIGDWTDSRPLTSDIVSQVCASSDACLAELVAGARARIDALRRPSLLAPPGGAYSAGAAQHRFAATP